MSDTSGAEPFDPNSFGITEGGGDNAQNPGGQVPPTVEPSIAGDSGDAGGDEPVVNLAGRIEHRPGERVKQEAAQQNDAQFLQGLSDEMEKAGITDPSIGLAPPDESLTQPPLAGIGSPAGDGDGGSSGQPQPPATPTVPDVTYPSATQTPPATSAPVDPAPPSPPPDPNEVDVAELAERLGLNPQQAAQFQPVPQGGGQQYQQPVAPQYPAQPGYQGDPYGNQGGVGYPQAAPVQPQYPQPVPQQQVSVAPQQSPAAVPPTIDPELYQALAPTVQAMLQQQMVPVQQAIQQQQQYIQQTEYQRQQDQLARNNAEIERARVEFRGQYSGLSATDYAVVEQRLIQSNSLQGFLAANPNDIHSGTIQALNAFALQDPVVRQKIVQAEIAAERTRQITEQQRQQKSTALAGGSGRVPGQGGSPNSSSGNGNGGNNGQANQNLVNALSEAMNN